MFLLRNSVVLSFMLFSFHTNLLSTSTSCDTVRQMEFAETRMKAQLFDLSNKLQALLVDVRDLAERRVCTAVEERVTTEKDKMSQIQASTRILHTKITDGLNIFSEVMKRKEENDRTVEHLRHGILRLRGLCRGDDAIDCPSNILGRDCAEILQKGGRRSGVYFIQPSKDFVPFPAYCDQQTEGGGWTYIHSHVNDDLDFNRSWLSYKHGFGHVNCNGKMNFWIGNEAIHALTSSRYYHLRVNVTDWSDNDGYATYTIFNVGPDDSHYRLSIGGYVEATHHDMRIGDGFLGYNFGHADDIQFTSHDSMKFSTFDRDNDLYPGSCANQDGGGWWFNRCSAVNLNGRIYRRGFYGATDTLYGFDNGMIWGPWTGLWYSLKASSMKIRPASFNDGN